MRTSGRAWILVPALMGLVLIALAPSAEATYYPMNQTTTGTWYTNTSSNYTWGWQFSALSGGLTVTHLGANTYTPYNRNIRLWNTNQQLLGEVTLTNTAGWHFTALSTPVSLTQGTNYIVSEWGIGYMYVYLPGWTGDTYISKANVSYYYNQTSHTYPIYTSTTTYMYGVPDIGYLTTPPPTVPASITVPAQSTSGNFTVSWAAATGATPITYELEESVNSTFTNAMQVYTGSALSYNVVGKSNGSYYYRVRAQNVGGYSGWRAGTSPCVVVLLPSSPAWISVPLSSMTGNFAVTWASVPTASTYELEESFNSGAWTQVYSGTGTMWSAVGVADGVYGYRVRSGNVAGYSNYLTAPNVCVVMRPPTAPASLNVPFTDGDGVYAVTWSLSSTMGVNYRFQEDTDANFSNPTQLYLGPSTSFTVGGGSSPNQPRGNGTYYYRVRSENGAGSSGWTYGANGCTVQLPPPPAPTWIRYEDPPGTTVTRTTSSPDVNGNYTVAWAASAGATGYQLQEANNVSFVGALTVYSGANTALAVVGNPGMPPTGVTYFYRVRAQNGSGWSAWTTETAGCHVEVPAPGSVVSVLIENTPGGGAAPNPDVDGDYYVTWTAATGAATYEVEEAANPSFAGSTLIYQGTNLQHHVQGKSNGTFYYRVRALNSSGPSAWTAAPSGIQVLLPPPAPTTITVPATSPSGNYQLTWSSADTAVQYELQESVDGGAFATVYTGSSLFFDALGRGSASAAMVYGYRVRAGNSSGWSNWTTGGTCTVLYPPANVASITVPATSVSGSFTVSWASEPLADSYDLQEATSSTFADAVQVYSGANVSFPVTGKVSGTFWYRVRARNTTGVSAAWTESANGCTIIPPGTPTGLTCPATSPLGSWVVSWNPVAGATGYLLEESDNGGGSWSTAYSGPNTSFTVTGKASGTFQYRVTAFNGAGSSAASGTVSLTMVAPLPPVSVTVPSSSISGYYTVNWTASVGATSYTLEESDNGGATWNVVFTGNANSFYATGRQGTPAAPVTYRYRVLAANAVGSSGWTNSANGCTVTLTAPGAPGSITVPANSVTGSIPLTWSTVWGATGYEVQESLDPAFNAPITVYTGPNTAFTVVGKADGIYYYRVRATNPVGASGYTPGANGCTVRLVPPSPPGTFVVPFTSFSGIYKIYWSMGSGAMWYEVQEDTDPNFGNPAVVYLGGSVACTLIGKPTGTYYYRVRSVNPIGESSWVPGSNSCMVAIVTPAVAVFPGPANPQATREVPGAAGVSLFQLAVAVGTGGPVKITDVTFHGSGSGDEVVSVAAVRLYEDVDADGVVNLAVDRQIGAAQTFTADDGAVVFAGIDETLLPGTLVHWLVTYDFQTAAGLGEAFRLELSANGDLVVEDPAWPGSIITPNGAPLQGGLKTLSTTGSGDLQVFLGPATPPPDIVPPGSTAVPVTQFNLVASSLEGVNVSSFRVWAVGSGNDAADIPNVSLLLDANGNGMADSGETVLASGTFTADNGTLTFVLGTPLLVPAQGSVKLLLLYDFFVGIAGVFNYTAGVLSGGDIATAGAATTIPVAITGPPVVGHYTTIDTPPPAQNEIDPEFSMGGCAGGSGGSGLAWILPFLVLVAALGFLRRPGVSRA